MNTFVPTAASWEPTSTADDSNRAYVDSQTGFIVRTNDRIDPQRQAAAQAHAMRIAFPAMEWIADYMRKRHPDWREVTVERQHIFHEIRAQASMHCPMHGELLIVRVGVSEFDFKMCTNDQLHDACRNFADRIKQEFEKHWIPY